MAYFDARPLAAMPPPAPKVAPLLCATGTADREAVLAVPTHCGYAPTLPRSDVAPWRQRWRIAADGAAALEEPPAPILRTGAQTVLPGQGPAMRKLLRLALALLCLLVGRNRPWNVIASCCPRRRSCIFDIAHTPVAQCARCCCCCRSARARSDGAACV